MQNIYSTQWIRKIKEILQRCGSINTIKKNHFENIPLIHSNTVYVND